MTLGALASCPLAACPLAACPLAEGPPAGIFAGLSLAAGPRLVADLPLAAVAAIGLALVAGVLALERRAPATRGRRALRAALRASILLALLGVVTGLATTTTAPVRPALVILVDEASRATPEDAADVEELLQRAAAAAGTDGGAPPIVLPFDARPGAVGAGRAPATDARSRLAPALVAARLVTGGAPARVVVVTDGRLDLEGAEAVQRAGEADGFEVRGVLVPPPPPPPAPSALRVEAIDAPLVARGPLAVRGAVRTDRPADVRLLVDGVERGRVRVEAPGGEVHFEDQVLAPGSYELALHVVEAAAPAARDAPHTSAKDAAADRPSAATLRRSLTRVRAPQRVTLVTPHPDGGALRRRLQAQGIDADVASPADADASSAVAATSAEALVLDADAAALASPALLEAVARRVEAGTGLLFLAGRDASAWTAVGQGPLARVLPFAPRPFPAPPPPPPPSPTPPAPPDPTDEPGPGVVAERRPEDALPLTLLLVIDRSGSMSLQGKLAMAIAAAEEAAAQLAPTDRVGVVTFADDATLDLPPRAAREVAVRSLAVGLVADGNTDIYRALSLAHKTMQAEASPIRHVVLLTDGYDTRSSVYGSLPAEYAAERITLTVVGLGRQIDERSLKTLARQAGGTFRYAPTPHDLPRILTRDAAAVLHARSAAADAARRAAPAPAPAGPRVEPAQPASRDPTVRPPPEDPPPPTPGPDLRPLRRARPHDSIAGFLGTDLPDVGAPWPGTPGPACAVVLDRDDAPALVAGRAGLGRVLVLAVADDDAGLRGWRLLPRLLAQAVRSVAGNVPPADAAELRVERVLHGDVLIASFPAGADPVATREVSLEVYVDTPRGPQAATPVPSAVETARPDDGAERWYALPGVETPLGTVRATLRGPDGSRRTLPPLTYVPAPPPAPAPVDAEGLARVLGGAVTARPDDAAIADWVRGVGAHRASRPASRSTRRSLALPLLALALALLSLDAFAHRKGPSTWGRVAAPPRSVSSSAAGSVPATSTSGVGGPT